MLVPLYVLQFMVMSIFAELRQIFDSGIAEVRLHIRDVLTVLETNCGPLSMSALWSGSFLGETLPVSILNLIIIVIIPFIIGAVIGTYKYLVLLYIFYLVALLIN